jgi:beta-glucosidase
MEKCMARIVQGIALWTGSLFFGLIVQCVVAQDTASLPYMNPNLSPEQRAVDLVHRMTLAEKASQMQNNSAAIPRLNVPAYQWWSEALHGVINQGVTEYPEPIGLAATFDTPGVHAMATQIGVEGSIKHEQNTRDGAEARRPTAKIHF